jgi:biopolymer transport protein ExbB
MDWIVIVEWLARLILVILVGLSCWSVAVIVEKYKQFKIFAGSTDLLSNFENYQVEKLINVPLGKDLIEILKKHPQNQEKTLGELDWYLSKQKKNWESQLSVLSTLGSVTPFVGLLGTILGIIVSFGKLSKGAAGTNDVMFALAEALILTAVGLVVAIPAVVAFNYFQKKKSTLLKDLRDSVKISLSRGYTWP